MENLTVIKYSLITGAKFITLLLALLFVVTKCGGCDSHIVTPKTDNTNLFAKMKSDSIAIVGLMESRYRDSLKTIASKHSEDSIKKVSDNYAKLYRGSAKKVRELIALGICDTVEIKVALNDCDSTIKSKDVLIAQKDSTCKSINKQLVTAKQELIVTKEIIDISKIVIKNKDDDYKALEDSSKKELRKQKAKTIGAIIIASITEVLTILALK
jgi:hypothetical protein